jgi:CRP-like cAMP-binding protein
MTNAETHDRLRSCPLFRDFTDEELSEFVDLLDPIEAKAGEFIVKQDEMGDRMFLLLSGQARVVHHRDGHEVELAQLKSGDFFGELALVDQQPRSADVQVTEDSALLEITQATISALAGVYPMAAFKFLITLGRLLVDRLRKSNQRYVDSLLFPIAGKE